MISKSMDQGKKMVEIQERRQCTRTFFSTRAQVLLDNGHTIVEGELQDISIIGMFIETKACIAVGSSCSIQIIISAQHSRLILEDIQGVITRQEDKGLGIQFTSNMEWFVIFKIYTHFSGHSELQSAVAASLQLDESKWFTHADRRTGVADRRKKDR